MKKTTALIALVFAGCVPLQSRIVGREQELVVYPKINQDSRVSQGILNPNTFSSIATLDIVPYIEVSADVYSPISALTGDPTTPGAADQLKLSQASPTIDPNRPFIIRKLRPSKKYRVYGRAYNQSNVLISQDSSSSVDVNVGTSDTPDMATLPVNLLNTTFAASTSVFINADGRYDYLRSTLYQVSGGAQVALSQTSRPNPELSFANLQGATNYRLVVEGYKLGSMFASASLDLNIGNDTTPSTQSIALKIPYVVSTLAGALATAGAVDGTGTAALFNAPYGVAVDVAGNVFVGDRNNQAIRKITPAGVVTTWAGALTVGGQVDGTGASARFAGPLGMAFDAAGYLYVADSDNQVVRKISPAGVVTTLAGSFLATGSVDATGTAARFNWPHSIALDGAGNVYVGDHLNHAIRKITPSGVVTILAGLMGTKGFVDGTGTDARFSFPQGVAVDASGNVYVADGDNHAIRKITPAGVVTTWAGTLKAPGSLDGTGNAARFNIPAGVFFDGSGNLYVGDRDNHSIRKITPGGVVSTVAGLSGTLGSQDGTGTAARFNMPHGLTVDWAGNVYVADYYSHSIRVLR